MQACHYQEFKKQPEVLTVPDPTISDDAVLIKVEAAGICLSDWHGWQGHDPDIQLPHVPGHEFAGVILECGKKVEKFRPGQRVTVPFVGGCGKCRYCENGNPQVCPDQFQAGFTHWGCFAEFVEIKFADFNLVELPANIHFTEAASLGCRFATAFRAIKDQAKVTAGQWVAIHGCGGVGLSALMICKALGAHVVAIDPNQGALERSNMLGADLLISELNIEAITTQLEENIGRRVDVSIDAYGSEKSAINSIHSLDRRGKHIQVGLVTNENGLQNFPMSKVIAHELEIIGSHGIQASRYETMLDFLLEHNIDLTKLISDTCSLTESIDYLINMERSDSHGMNIITRFTE